jgi:hypothetical protein
MIRGQGHPFALFAKGWASALPQSSGAARGLEDYRPRLSAYSTSNFFNFRIY